MVMREGDVVILNVRLSKETMGRVDAAIARRAVKQPHVRWTRSALVREAVDALLAREPPEHLRKAKKSDP